MKNPLPQSVNEELTRHPTTPNSTTGDDTRMGSDHESPPSTPRWVKVFVIIALVLVLMVVIMMFTGVSGEHGPGRHIPSGDAGGRTPPIEHRVQQP